MRAMIVRSDKSGLGYQTLALAQMLRPQKIMLVDSGPFNHAAQHPDWYEGYKGVVVRGFPNAREKQAFMQDVTSLLTCEIPYGYDLFDVARARGAKTFLQFNYEFFDYSLHPTLPQPTIFISPSYWHLGDVQDTYPNTVYLPPPTSHQEFLSAREANMSRSGRCRFLHIVGRLAAEDRNGTQDLLKALRHSTEDYQLVIKAQAPLELDIDDPRVTLNYQNPDDRAELYKDFDALILPRRYGGLCLPMNEALMSGLPAIMTNVSPNDQVLPPHWLVPAAMTGTFMTRSMIDLYSADPVALGSKLDELASMDRSELSNWKSAAFDLGYSNYSSEVLRPRYEELLA